MGKTYIAICATAALGLCLMAPKDASALPAADGAGKALSAVAGKSAVTQVRYAGRAGAAGFHRGIGYRHMGYGVGHRRFGLGYGLGHRRFGLGYGVGHRRFGLGYGLGHRRFGLGYGVGHRRYGLGYGLGYRRLVRLWPGYRRYGLGYGLGYRRFGLGYGLGYRRFGLGYGLGYRRFGFGAGLGVAGAGCGYGHVRVVAPGTSYCTCGWSLYGSPQDCACGYY